MHLRRVCCDERRLNVRTERRYTVWFHVKCNHFKLNSAALTLMNAMFKNLLLYWVVLYALVCVWTLKYDQLERNGFLPRQHAQMSELIVAADILQIRGAKHITWNQLSVVKNGYIKGIFHWKPKSTYFVWVLCFWRWIFALVKWK